MTSKITIIKINWIELFSLYVSSTLASFIAELSWTRKFPRHLQSLGSNGVISFQTKFPFNITF